MTSIHAIGFNLAKISNLTLLISQILRNTTQNVRLSNTVTVSLNGTNVQNG